VISVRMTATPESQKAFSKSFDKLARAPRKIGDQAAPHFARLIGSRIEQIFEREGPGWAPLARSTVAERQRLGFPGRRPILRRSGSLLAALTEPTNAGHVLDIVRVGQGTTMLYYGTRDVRFQPLQRGLVTHNLPARPMLPVDYPEVQGALDDLMRESLTAHLDWAVK